jgi:flagellin-specific chaperone FliS
MQPLSRTPAAAYQRVDLDARIEASSAADLTRICLEEAIAALGRALIALERAPDTVPREPLSRAHAITLYLARSVEPETPLRTALVQFYGGQAEVLSRNMIHARLRDIMQVRIDLADLLEAARAA